LKSLYNLSFRIADKKLYAPVNVPLSISTKLPLSPLEPVCFGNFSKTQMARTYTDTTSTHYSLYEPTIFKEVLNSLSLCLGGYYFNVGGLSFGFTRDSSFSIFFSLKDSFHQRINFEVPNLGNVEGIFGLGFERFTPCSIQDFPQKVWAVYSTLF
jgi:hypothetical protein